MRFFPALIACMMSASLVGCVIPADEVYVVDNGHGRVHHAPPPKHHVHKPPVYHKPAKPHPKPTVHKPAPSKPKPPAVKPHQPKPKPKPQAVTKPLRPKPQTVHKPATNKPDRKPDRKHSTRPDGQR